MKSQQNTQQFTMGKEGFQCIKFQSYEGGYPILNFAFSFEFPVTSLLLSIPQGGIQLPKDSSELLIL
jgi:hypothetical protein